MQGRNHIHQLSLFHFYRWLCAALTLGMFSSCTYYYMPVQRPSASLNERASSIRSLHDSGRYLILRHKDSAYRISQLQFREDSSTADLQLDYLAPEKRKYVENTKKRNRIYGTSKRNRDTAMLKEAHIFVSPELPVQAGKYALHMGNVTNIEALENDAKKNKFSKDLNAVLIPVTLGMLIAMVVAFVGISSWG